MFVTDVLAPKRHQAISNCHVGFSMNGGCNDGHKLMHELMLLLVSNTERGCEASKPKNSRQGRYT